MSDPDPSLVAIDRARAIAAVASRLLQAGFSDAAAAVTATHLVRAEADGRASHGLRLLLEYLREARNGRIDTAATLTLTADDGAMLLFDARRAPGHQALSEAMDACIARARRDGVVLAWVRRLSHTGRLADYVRQATDRGCGVILTVASALDDTLALVSPPGSSRRLLGSNPLAIGISDPAGAHVCYDGSTAAIPFYELLRCREAGGILDDDAIVDADGRPSRDPAAFFEGGAIRPSGGGRGFGLSIALALLTQIRCPSDEPDGFKAFTIVFRQDGTDSGLVASTVERLRRAGARVPGAPGPSGDPATLHTSRATVDALADVGVTLR